MSNQHLIVDIFRGICVIPLRQLWVRRFYYSRTGTKAVELTITFQDLLFFIGWNTTKNRGSISSRLKIVYYLFFLGFGDVCSYPHVPSNDLPISCTEFSRSRCVVAAAAILTPQLNSRLVLHLLRNCTTAYQSYAA